MHLNKKAAHAILDLGLEKPDLSPVDISTLVTKEISELDLHLAALILGDLGMIVYQEDRTQVRFHPLKMNKINLIRLTALAYNQLDPERNEPSEQWPLNK